jgi:CRP-like cAMP-binding protein
VSLDADVRRLARVRPFDALPREALQLLAFSCAKRGLKAGDRLFARGDRADSGFFVLEGEIALSRPGEERRARAGALIGEQALLAETRRAVDAVAAADSQLLVIPAETFRRVLGEFPEGANAIRRAAAARAGALIGRLENLRRRAFAPARSA